ncbi:MAG: Rpn family recombination-promoting nuclease/putative transposase [Lachnospiraceae bacterium]
MTQILHTSEQVPEVTSFMNASGPVRYPLTNDYLFRAVLQKNNHVLKGLICSLLHLSPDEVISVTVNNPIELGATIEKKDFYLDINVLLNSQIQLNLEMQIINYGNWPERSLSYLCRSFDSLNSGEDYKKIKSVIHIGFLDFTLFPDSPEFYSKYMLMNVKKHTIYSDKFILSVVDLTQIELATEEDKENQLDYWASLFKATTWEDIKMIAKNNSYFAEAAETMYQLSADEQIRLQCQARADFERQERSNRHQHEEEVASLKAEIVTLQETNTALREENAALKEKCAALEEKCAALEEQCATLEKQCSILEEQCSILEEQCNSMQGDFSKRLAALEAVTEN